MMKRKTALVLYNTFQNKYSFTALTGALEKDRFFSALPFSSCQDKGQLFAEISRLLESNTSVVAAFSFFTSQVWETEQLIREVRTQFGGNVLCVAGGAHATGDAANTLRMGFDIVFLGEGEESFPSFLKAYCRNEEYRTIQGLAFLDSGGRMRSTRKARRVHLDPYPLLSVKNRFYGPLEISRGCVYGCRYCQVTPLYGKKVVHRSVKSICAGVKAMAGQGLKDIRVLTPNAFSYGSASGRTVNLKALEALLEGMRKSMNSRQKLFFGTFPSEVRPEHVSHDTLTLLCRYSNNSNIIIGAQSGSQRMLDLCNRSHTVQEVYRAVELASRFGLTPNIDVIFGLPGEEEDDARLTIKAMTDFISMGAKVHAHAFMPLPQTPFARYPAGTLSGATERAVHKLMAHGAVYGTWKEQLLMGKRNERYLGGNEGRSQKVTKTGAVLS